MRILVLLHGTVLMHAAGAGCSRQERVRQVIEGHPSVRAFAEYVPLGNAVRKLDGWCSQGEEIHYLSSHENQDRVAEDERVLRRHGFPAAPIHFRRRGEDWSAVVGRVRPDVLIEDDCESIGGLVEMVYSNLPEPVRDRILSVVVEEFAGIDHLPDEVRAMTNDPRTG